MKGLSLIIAIIIRSHFSDAQALNAKQDVDDKTFISQAIVGGFKETNASEMAMHVAITTDVKDFAKKMIADHGKANRELKSIIKSKGYHIKVPSVDDVTRDPLLGGTTGTAFENNYILLMIKDHKKMLTLFKNAAGQIQDPEIRAFAKRTLPILQQHWASIKALAEKRKLNIR
ncbi:DUF4142 domain-containing protein [Mucilaginibacter sp. NFX135]|uniref:DUF4142 domain-containing protein n=1 Tax=Mucilaginibacter sp. NFX135 TaxID=3402687 RepID=UPI003AFB7AED